MNKKFLLFAVSAVAIAAAQDKPAITIYNGDFAVVRQNVHLDFQNAVALTFFAAAALYIEAKAA